VGHNSSCLSATGEGIEELLQRLNTTTEVLDQCQNLYGMMPEVSRGAAGAGSGAGSGAGGAHAELHTWLGRTAGLKGKKFEAARAACAHHLLERAGEVREVHAERTPAHGLKHISVEGRGRGGDTREWTVAPALTPGGRWIPAHA
jgi:hypothetical protein